MTPSSHIFEYAHNSAPLYNRMRIWQNIKDATPRMVAYISHEVANAAHAEMVRDGEIERGEYTAQDILKAAIHIADWIG